MADASPVTSGRAPVPELSIRDTKDLDERLRTADAPFVVRGLVNDWPLVQAGRRSAQEARDYLVEKSRDIPFTVSVADSRAEGRLFYDDRMQMNFRTLRAGLRQIFEKIAATERDANPPAIYLASIDMDNFFVGLHDANCVDLGNRDCLASIWMGTPTRIAAHNDFPDNLACVAVGRRRFTLFPPDQFRNLYLGPMDNTPAGRAVSMVNFHDPDFAAHPGFREALTAAQVVELGAGDAIHIPSMWWHHIEALEPFNVLVNYWWRDTPRWLGQPQNALNLAMLAIRDLPEDEKQHWRDLFDYYVFDNKDDVIAHIPPSSRTILAPFTAETAALLHAHILGALSR